MAKSSRKMLAAAVIVLVAFGARAAPAGANAEGWTWPLAGPVITPYLNDNSRPYAAGMHRGIDIAAAVGTKVVSAHAGSVTYAGSLGSSGLTVAVATSDGAYVTSYLHLSRISVKRGDALEAGGEVGGVGTTGTRSATEPHLHFGVRRADEPDSYVDPQSLLPTPTPPQRAVPQASVPARLPVRAGPASAPVPPTLTVPLGRPPRTVPLRARAPAVTVLRWERRTGAEGPAPARGLELPSEPSLAVAAPPRRRPLPQQAGHPGRRPVAGVPLSAPQAADPARSRWGQLLTIAGLAIFAAAIAGLKLLASAHRKLRGLTCVRRKRTQPRARPAGPAGNRLAGLSQVS
jgi:hypothetical protein